jgi:Fe2+ transport system protein FeoA
MSDKAEQFAGLGDLLGFKVRRYAVHEARGKKWRFQSLTEKEKTDYELRPAEKTGAIDLKRAHQQKRRLLVMSLVNGDGVRIATEANLAEIEQVDGALVQELFDFASKHCGIGKDGGAEHEKNSEATQGDSSQ